MIYIATWIYFHIPFVLNYMVDNVFDRSLIRLCFTSWFQCLCWRKDIGGTSLTIDQHLGEFPRGVGGYDLSQCMVHGIFTYYYPPCNQHFRTWKWMVGRWWTFLFGAFRPIFQVQKLGLNWMYTASCAWTLSETMAPGQKRHSCQWWPVKWPCTAPCGVNSDGAKLGRVFSGRMRTQFRASWTVAHIVIITTFMWKEKGLPKIKSLRLYKIGWQTWKRWS